MGLTSRDGQTIGAANIDGCNTALKTGMFSSMTEDDFKSDEYPIEFSWTLGAVLAQRREKLGFTQRHVAKLAGVAQRSYGEIERGVRVPRLPTLHLIARALDFPHFMELLNTAYQKYEHVYLKKAP